MAKLKSIDDLKFDEHNFNKHTKDGMSLLEKSVREHNFGRSILVDKDNNIIAGNGIVETAKKLDKTKIKVVETTGDELVVVKRTDVDINSKAGREMALADNATSANDLAWNEEELALAEKMWDVDIAGWGVDSFKEELDAYREAEEDGYAENDNVIEPVVKNGELWQLGEHRLYCGDSTKITDIQTLMGGVVADLCVTDPPYNVDYESADGKSIANDNMGDDAFIQFLTDSFVNISEVLKDGGAFYIWHADSQGLNFRLAAEAAGLKIRQCLVWNKNSFVLGRKDYQCKHEPCLYGWKDGAGHYFCHRRDLKTVHEDKLDFDEMKKEDMKKLLEDIYSSYPVTVINEDKPLKSEQHPTMKPVRMIGNLITNSSRENEVVLDAFGGSGTTLIACEQLNRKCRMMEYDPHYCDVIIDRWEKLTGKQAVKIY